MGFLGNLWNDITGVTASNKAAAAQQVGIADARGQLDPFASAGQDATQAQAALSGALGPEAQQAAVDQLQNSPMFQSFVQQGEQGILQNASATGGLRGGNVQGALAQFAPQMLNQQIQQRFQNLGGIANRGLAASQQTAGLATSSGNVEASRGLGNFNLQRNFLGDVAGFGLNLAGLPGIGRIGKGISAGLSSLFGGGGGSLKPSR